MLKSKKLTIIKYICLVCYIICVAVLVFEACMDGQNSGQQSNAVGGTLADIINALRGDQTTAVQPEYLEIENSISSAYVGDVIQLEVTTYPENATYKQLSFSTSDPSVAVVNGEGEVTFVSNGSVTISVCNSQFEDVATQMTVAVSNVIAQRIEATLSCEKVGDWYVLEQNGEYPLFVEFFPENTTNQQLLFSCEQNDFVSVSTNGVITAKKKSNDQIIDVVVTHLTPTGWLTATVKVVVQNSNEVELQGFFATAPSLCIGQTASLNVSFIPTNATFKGYVLTSNNTSVVAISGRRIVGRGVGTATITITSTTYPEISFQLEVEVSTAPQVDVDRTTVTLSSNLFVGDVSKIRINKYPSYAQNPTVTYSSSNSAVATVDNQGNVTGVGQGDATITVTINGTQFQLSVSVRAKVDTLTTGFTLKQTTFTLLCQQEYDLQQLIEVQSWQPNTPENPTLSYLLLDSSQGILDGSFTPEKAGTYTLLVIHQDSAIQKEVTFLCVNDFSLSQDMASLIVGQSILVELNTQQDVNQTFVVETSSNAVGITQNNDSISIVAVDVGVVEIVITPVVGNVTVTELAKTLTVTITHLYTTTLDCQLLTQNQPVQSTDEVYQLTLDKVYSLEAILSQTATFWQIRFSSSNQNVATINTNGQIELHAPGSATLQVTDLASDLSVQIEIEVNNVIALSDTPFALVGETVAQNNDGFTLQNGNSAQLVVNFADNTTFDNVTFSSSDENVATIGANGTITPHKVGRTTITAVVDDGFLPPLTIQFELTVKRQDAITDLSKFFYQVRKGIGHFGAFLVMGIFSTLSWLLFFGDKKMFFSVPVNFALGFGIASLTEIIQLYVPGRYGSMDDIMLDFSGFSVSAIVITVILVAIALIKRFKNKKG